MNSILIGISAIILTVTFCILIVSHFAYKRGKLSGVELGIEKGKVEGITIGREQVLNENLVRLKYEIDDHEELYELVENIHESHCDMNSDIKDERKIH